jgi:predicted transposase YdaD
VTLWLRILGKGRVQEQAIKEVAALPLEHPQRDNVLDLLVNLRVTLEARTNIEPEDQELVMQLSPLYLEKIRAAELVGEQRGAQLGEQRGEIREAQVLIFRQLNRRVGNVPMEIESRVKMLTLTRLEELGEALLDFTQMGDLLDWLAENE